MDCGGKTLSFAAEWIVLISFRNKFGNSQREEGDEAGNSCCFSHGFLVPIQASVSTVANTAHLCAELFTFIGNATQCVHNLCK